MAKGRPRLLYLDWVRGLAAAIMLQGHVFHSFLKPELRSGSAYTLSQFFGGMPPAIFLFLTGVTFAFLMHSQERKALPLVKRWLGALKRSGYLFALAFAFRFQLWLFAWPNSPWTDLFRVDILNCMGFAMLIMSPMVVFTTMERVKYALVAGLAIAAASPLVSMVDPRLTPGIVHNYLVPDHNFFSFFPWAAYLAFGLSFGSLLRVVPSDYTDRLMQWSLLVGGLLFMASQYGSSLPYSLYATSDFWLNSPWQVLAKTGIVLSVLSIAWLWTTFCAPGWSWLRQLGTTSLLVYWVHIELIYGRWLWFWKEGLDVPSTITASISLILLMVTISVLRTNGSGLRGLFGGWGTAPVQRVSGD